jgi:hypothetical protein
MCGTSVSSAMVSNAAKKLDEVLNTWRERPLGKELASLPRHAWHNSFSSSDAWNDILKKDNFVKKLCSREWIELDIK